MKFKIIVAADDNSEVDYSIEYLSATDAKKFIDGWQQLQDKTAQHKLHTDASERCNHGNLRGKCYVETCGFSKPTEVG